MKKIFYLVLLACASVSCKSYMLSTVAADSPTEMTSNGVFKLENDSVRITYNFSGMDAPLKIDIYNKLNHPIYVNWNNSALIIKEKAYSFIQSDIKISGSTTAISDNNRRSLYNYSEGSINALATLPNNEGFIPPSSQITREITVLDAAGFDSFPKSVYKRGALNYNDGTGVVYIKQANFEADNSPFKFKSYITLYTLNDGKQNNFVSSGNFYVSSITRSGANPKSISEYEGNPGNVMMTSRTTGFGKAMTGVALVGAAGGLAVADATLNDKNNNRNRSVN